MTGSRSFAFMVYDRRSLWRLDLSVVEISEHS